MASGLWRALVIAHRYLGIAVGVLMLMWFASGIVMMYVAFPQGIGKERLGTLPLIAWRGCCRIEVPLRDNDVFERAEVETLLGRPVLRLRRQLLPQEVIDLDSGAAKEIDFDLAQSIARDAAPRLVGADAPIAAAEEIEDDQWTVGRYRAERPLFRFGFADPAATTLYVSGTGGRVVLRTTASQRFWNWLGAVPHWIYPTALRSNGLLWSRIVIWASILGIFLTVLGLYLGIAQFKRGKRLSPYRASASAQPASISRFAESASISRRSHASAQQREHGSPHRKRLPLRPNRNALQPFERHRLFWLLFHRTESILAEVMP
jgi:uncharacterized iron-regulated membrane protein